MLHVLQQKRTSLPEGDFPITLARSGSHGVLHRSQITSSLMLGNATIAFGDATTIFSGEGAFCCGLELPVDAVGFVVFTAFDVFFFTTFGFKAFFLAAFFFPPFFFFFVSVAASASKAASGPAP